ncbi:MAG TPA: NAD(P)H-dependent oxidoreductase [Magnetospirillaceae bacterium]|nr:NAD(P)H-dependent oxidoreductase [Magnetospirillaceae bacterium]
MTEKPLRIIALSGSLRRESYTTKLVKAFGQLVPDGVTLELVDGLGELPFFNEDIEQRPPRAVIDFIAKLKTADAFLFATPEYNRSYSAVLKNAIDWPSRHKELIFYQKPAAVIGVTPYSLGAFGAVHHLRQVLTYLNMYTLQQPEFHVSQAAEKFDKKGSLTDESTIRHIENFWREYEAWIRKIIK